MLDPAPKRGRINGFDRRQIFPDMRKNFVKFLNAPLQANCFVKEFRSIGRENQSLVSQY